MPPQQSQYSSLCHCRGKDMKVFEHLAGKKNVIQWNKKGQWVECSPNSIQIYKHHNNICYVESIYSNKNKAKTLLFVLLFVRQRRGRFAEPQEPCYLKHISMWDVGMGAKLNLQPWAPVLFLYFGTSSVTSCFILYLSLLSVKERHQSK